MVFSSAPGYCPLYLDLEIKEGSVLPHTKPSICYHQGKLFAKSQNHKMFLGTVDVALGFGFSIISVLVYSEQLWWSHLHKSVQVHGARVQIAEWQLLDWCAPGQVEQAGDTCFSATYRNPEQELVRMLWISKGKGGGLNADLGSLGHSLTSSSRRNFRCSAGSTTQSPPPAHQRSCPHLSVPEPFAQFPH